MLRKYRKIRKFFNRSTNRKWKPKKKLLKFVETKKRTRKTIIKDRITIKRKRWRTFKLKKDYRNFKSKLEPWRKNLRSN